MTRVVKIAVERCGAFGSRRDTAGELGEVTFAPENA